MTGVFFLYFTACMANAPETCEARRMPLDVATPRACQHVAQPQLARWIGEHPEYRIAGWRCGTPLRDPGTRI